MSIKSAENATATIIGEFVAAEVPLEHLVVHASNFQLFDAISNMKTLKKLYLFSIYNMNIPQLHRIFRNLRELTDLVLGHFASNFLLEIVRNAKKLQRLKIWQNNIKINSDTYANLVKILKQRPEKTQLELAIYEMVYKKISYERPHEDILVITEHTCSSKSHFGSFWPDLLY